ncbi:MAG: hypothetical protein KDN22_31895 [Verrucomicrobiae bacterium]|nr:hypothetical protein [Verrucomicrobiae bacterium]
MEKQIWHQALHPQAARMQQEPMERKAVMVPLVNLMLVQRVATHQSLSLPRRMEMPGPRRRWMRRKARHLALGHLTMDERAAENALAEHRRTESAHLNSAPSLPVEPYRREIWPLDQV